MRLRNILLAIAAVSFVLSCGNKEEPDPQPEVKPEIKVPTESQAIFNNGITFDSGSESSSSSSGQAQSTTVKFTATEAWSANVADTKAPSWLSVQPAGGGAGSVTMTVTAQPNTTDKARSATVTIQCGTVKQSFTVKQDAAAPQTVAVESVTLNKTELTLEPSGTETLTVTVAPENATDKTVTWSTSNAEIATVADGKVTAVKEGEAIITAKAGEKQATCKVTVKKAIVAVESVTLNKTELTLEPGGTETLVATVKPDNASDKTVTWTTSNAEIATVTDGKVTAVKEGEATITAKAGEKQATCTVVVKKGVIAVTSITLNKNDLALKVGEDETLIATVLPEDATDKTVTWISSDSAIAGVEQTGKVTAVKEGEATITAKAGEKEATCKVVVSAADVPFSLSPTSVEMDADGGTFDVTVTCSTTYHMNSKPDWVTEKAVNGKVHTFEVSANTSTEQRSGVIVFCDDKGTCLPCNVKQEGKEEDLPFSVSPTSVEMEAEGGTFDVTVTCSTTYHMNSKPDWVTEKAVNGKVHTFEVSANTGTEQRNGVIVFCDDKGTCLPCNVKQKAGSSGESPFSLSPSNVEIGAYGGTFNVTVTCSTSYHLNSTPDWVTEQSVSNNVHTFLVSANSSTEQRSGLVVFCDDKGTCLPCNVKQRGADSGGGESGFDWTKEFFHQSLFMRFTATWCGYCPMMAEAVKIAQGKHPGKIQALNLHTTNSDLFFQPGLTLESIYSINGYPSGVIDGRKQIGNYDIETTASNIEKAFEQFEAAMRPVTTMGWQSSFSGQSLSIDLAMYIKSPGSYKVTVILTESGIIKKQVDYINGDQPNYQHNDVARVAVSDISGDMFTVSESNHVEKKSYSTTIPSSYNKENMKILVYIQRAYGNGVSKIESSDYSGWYIDNCNSGKAGGNMSPAVAQEGSGGENEDVVGGNPINW